MKVRTIGISVLAAGLLAVGTEALAERPANRGGFLTYDIEEEVAIRKQFADFTAAWNRHDIKAMLTFYALDADHVEPDLQVARGREEIEKLFKLEHDTIFKGSELILAIESVWFVTDRVALVDGAYNITGIKGPDGKDFPSSKGHLTGLLLRERDRWWVVASRSMMPIPPAWRPDFEKWAKEKK